MTYNLQKKRKFTITRYIKYIYTWEKNKNNKKSIESAINNIKKYSKIKSNNISEYLVIFLRYNTQQLFLYKMTVKPFTR